ncbi:ATP-binding protein [Isoptericola croceus]|uniref:ATP-binding protein n=1 Tax=Isoptericola croceus TaxID=3031406 RepID=UPI0023F7D823|nr:sensor histidine kinase [Isoptericola croceus]
MHRRMSLARQLFVLQLSVIVLLVGSGTLVAFLDAQRVSEAGAERRVLTLASALAELPEVRAALTEDDPSTTLQPIAESVREATSTDFIVFMATDRTRYSHPNPDRIGEPFLGTIGPALAGGTVTETYDGTLGPSVRAVLPVYGEDGEVAALISIGVLRSQIGKELLARVPALLGVAAIAIAVAALGSWAISRRLDRQTLGLGPVEITRMYEQHDAVLHAVREGLVIVDLDGRLTLANDEAARLLSLPADAQGREVGSLGLDEPLRTLLRTGEQVSDRLIVYRDRVLVASSEPATKDGKVLGVVTTLRDHTELETLSGELDSARGFAEALRAQAHESANRLHTVVTMIELGQPEKAVELATVELASAQQLADQVMGSVDEPALAALLLGKAAQAHEKGVELVVSDDTELRDVDVSARDLVTLVGNLVDNAIDAALAAPPPRRVTVLARGQDGGLLFEVADSGPGVDPARVDDIFTRGWTTKTASGAHGQGLGLALVRQVITRYGGSVEVTHDGATTFSVRLPPAHAPGGGTR